MFWPALKDLQYCYGGVAVYPQGATFGPYPISTFEFVWIIEGDSVAYFNDVKIPAPEGTILLCRPGMVHRYEWAVERRTVHAYFHFQFQVPSQGWPTLTSWPLSRRMEGEDVLRPLFRYVLGLDGAPEPARSNLMIPAMESMVRAFVLGRADLPPEESSPLPEPVTRAWKLLEENALRQESAPLTLKDLARAAHVTPEHLCRLFRKSVQWTPLECERMIRLERAAVLLRNNSSIKEIAEATGFANPYHFSRSFRQLYKLSPRAYRKALYDGKNITPNPVTRLFKLPLRLLSRTVGGASSR